MKSFIFPAIILLFTLFVSCDNEPELKSENSALLTGSWTSPVFEDSIYTFTRATSLQENDYGLTFKADNQLVERKIAGWCGTPPVAYSDYLGTWTEADSTLYISSFFWGGTVHYQWKIVSLDNQNLIVKVIREDYIYTE